MRRPLTAILTALAAALAGCASDPPPTPAPGRMTKAEYSDAFVAGRYAEAYDKAASAAESADPGRMRDEAALVAGLSASQIDRSADARRWLEPLTRSNERDIAGRAGAGLGLMDQARGRHAEAAMLLRDASQKLTGDEGARAAYQAGQSYEALGQSDMARTQFSLAAAQATDPALKTQAQQRAQGVAAAPSGPAAGAFALQLGVFAKIQNAEECVRKNTPISTRLGLGLPRVQQRPDDGRTVYAVHVGRFATKEEAAARKKSFPGSTVSDTRGPRR